ncbi:extracellular solute-binding protein [Methylobacillus arboreus]|uniref:ABC transporter substrate-binding protein n=1 Tax=Methylobacillus arboreus TaxID=755170 RepID=UPI001E59CA48|nr:extracellular solute-binding protein [Methylobacillus arboreus]MCB5189250.1 extracellular solute-binding protein [Methylobacillus arboreus]
MARSLTIKAALSWPTRLLLAWLIIFSQAAFSDPGKVIVMTSYPQEVVSQFEAAFEQQYPQYKLEVLWRQSRDAMAYFKDSSHPVDVYWTPAQRNFAQLEKMQAFQPLKLDLAGLPAAVNGFALREGNHIATEIAGYGIVVNPQALANAGLPVPKSWEDLASPALQGKVALPVPSKVGYAPPLIDILLQGHGWQTGWNLLQQIAANAELVTSGATFVSDDVANGRLFAGLTIDFFTASAIANGAPLQFVYPAVTGYSPAHLGIMKNAANPEGAQAFSTFVLSDQGQRLLFHPDIRKLPVRPAVYADKPPAYFNPFENNPAFVYDSRRGLARQDTTNALFDAVITLNLNALQNAVRQIQAAGSRLGPDAPQVIQATTLLHTLPANETDAKHSQAPTATDIESWQQIMQQRYEEAARIASQP